MWIQLANAFLIALSVIGFFSLWFTIPLTFIIAISNDEPALKQYNLRRALSYSLPGIILLCLGILVATFSFAERQLPNGYEVVFVNNDHAGITAPSGLVKVDDVVDWTVSEAIVTGSMRDGYRFRLDTSTGEVAFEAR